MYSFVEGVKASEFRNIENYPILRKKVDDIKTSIEQTGEFRTIEVDGKNYKAHTGFWDNVNLYVSDEKWAPALEGIGFENMEAQLKLSKELIANGVQYQANGHHRMVALRELGIDIINCPNDFKTKPIRLKMMVQENLESFGGNAFTTVESVVQIATFMMFGTEGTESFAEYKKNVETPVFKSAKMYGAAMKAGAPSSRALQDFIGGTLSKDAVNTALTAHKYANAGIYVSDSIKQFPTIETLRMFNTLTSKLLKVEQPAGVIDYLVAECADIVLNHKSSGRDIENAGASVDAGKDPLPMLKSGLRQDFKLDKYLVKLIRNNVEVRLLKGMESDAAKEALVKAEKYIDDQAKKDVRNARREELEKTGKDVNEINEILISEGLLERVPAPPVVEPLPDNATPEQIEAHEQQVAANEAAQAEGGEETPPTTVGEDGLIDIPDRDSVKSKMNYSHSTMLTCTRQLTDLIGRVEEAKDQLAKEDMVDTFFPAVEKLHKVMVYLMMEHVGIDSIRKVVNASAKLPADEAGLDVKAA